MFLLVSFRQVGAHPDELQHGVSIQSPINLGKTFPRISCIRIIPSTQILARVFVYLLPFISQILNFICRMVLIFILTGVTLKTSNTGRIKSVPRFRNKECHENSIFPDFSGETVLYLWKSFSLKDGITPRRQMEKNLIKTLRAQPRGCYGKSGIYFSPSDRLLLKSKEWKQF